MANKKPFFLTGANAKIKLNGKTVAFATDISYSIQVQHVSPRVLGRFEVEDHQPVTYDVSGSFSIIRYTKGAAGVLGNSSPVNASGAGNGIGSFGAAGIGGAIGNAIGLPNSSGQIDGRADEAFVPARMMQSRTFDIEIFQKIPGASQDVTLGSIAENFFNNPLGTIVAAAKNPNNPLLVQNGVCQIALLENCRLTSSQFTLSNKNVARQTFNFVCKYAHEDGFVARKSGVGQELS